MPEPQVLCAASLDAYAAQSHQSRQYLFPLMGFLCADWQWQSSAPQTMPAYIFLHLTIDLHGCLCHPSLPSYTGDFSGPSVPPHHQAWILWLCVHNSAFCLRKQNYPSPALIHFPGLPDSETTQKMCENPIHFRWIFQEQK